MKYISTPENAPELNFEDVIITGLAAGSSLYVPETWPQLRVPYEVMVFYRRDH
jgi:threonine synthase